MPALLTRPPVNLVFFQADFTHSHIAKVLFYITYPFIISRGHFLEGNFLAFYSHTSKTEGFNLRISNKYGV
jgi:hypothetical protein